MELSWQGKPLPTFPTFVCFFWPQLLAGWGSLLAEDPQVSGLAAAPRPRSHAHLAPAREHQTPAKCLSSRRHGQVYRVSREMGAGNLQLWFYCSTRWVISSREAQVFKSLLLKLLKLNWQVWVVKQFIITSLPEDLEKQLKEQIVQSAQDCHSWGLSFLSCHPILFPLSPDIQLFSD